MNKLFQTLIFISLNILIITACSAQVIQAKAVDQPSMAAEYQNLLGKSVDDESVADFIAQNYCSSAGHYQVCGSRGIALELGADQKVSTVFFFPGRTASFAAFHGELPYGLRWEDTRAVVEQKLGVTPQTQYLQQADLPMENGIPANIRLWAVYQETGITVVYNTLSADKKDATIHAILMTK